MWFPTRSANNVFIMPFLRATNNFKNTNFMAQDSTRLDTRDRDNHTHAWRPTFCAASHVQQNLTHSLPSRCLIILQMQRKKIVLIWNFLPWYILYATLSVLKLSNSKCEKHKDLRCGAIRLRCHETIHTKYISTKYPIQKGFLNLSRKTSYNADPTAYTRSNSMSLIYNFHTLWYSV